ncbi:hypothetical protein [Intestinimonas butyriciproducens]|uniref:hypothetical protein n=1 Tax=Intestinimonas butyriciproducens TaxID=1297617 RepID=UPI00195DDED1|nr:hypothetical protein [Intestinimonas butyriciproducens]MBM6918746.1 hypothetical protein [Intestinimonas butyriciproducens]
MKIKGKWISPILLGFLIVLGGVLLWRFYFMGFFHHSPLSGSGNLYPRFSYQDVRKPEARTNLYTLQEGEWNKEGKGIPAYGIYQGFCPQEEGEALEKMSYYTSCLVFAQTIPQGQVYVYNLPEESSLSWQVLLKQGQDFQFFPLEKTSPSESLAHVGAWEKGIWLYRLPEEDDPFLTLLDLNTGKSQNKPFPRSSLQAGFLMEDRVLYDDIRDRLLFFYTRGSEKLLGQYDFATGQLFSLPLTQPVSHLLMTPEGYFLANTSSLRQVILYSYDFDWKEKDSITYHLDIPQDEIEVWQGCPFLVMEGGVLYGYLEGSRQSKLPGDWGMRDCFYALDTGSGQLLSLHFIRPGWGFLLQGVELLAEEGETPAFYTLPSGF